MCCDMLRDHLLGQNEQIKHGDTVRDHIEAIVGNTQAHIRYEFVDPNGKRHPKVKRETPLITWSVPLQLWFKNNEISSCIAV